MKRYILFQVKQFQNKIARSICMDMKKNNITSPPSLIQSEIIGYLVENEGKNIYQKDLETIFQLRRSTISGVLRTLEKNNLIKRVDIESDARMKKIVLTEKSEKIFLDATKYLEQLEKKVVTGITEKDLNTFYRVLEQMQQNLDE